MQGPRWIRTKSGFAGRNGYLIKTKEGYEVYEYGESLAACTFILASEAKESLDKIGKD